MQRVIVNMQSFAVSDALKIALNNEGDFNVTAVNEPDRVIDQCQNISANMVLLEIKGQSPWRLSERLSMIRELKQILPQCKVVFFVDDLADRFIAKQVKQAKCDGLIDQFIYGSSSASFMIALLETL